MQLTLNKAGQASTEMLEVSDVVFAASYNEALIHQVVTSYRNRARQGTKAQKTKAEVSGGGIKPWRQKGTGRARVGSSRSPLWRKGGVIFAAEPRNFENKVNKKMYKAAIRSILSELIRQDRLVVIEDIYFDSPKTKNMIALLQQYGLKDGMIVTQEVGENLYLASRNIPNIQVCEPEYMDPVSLVAYKKLLITREAIKQVEEQLQ
jgi:large subunit ribosomal protein L4